MHLSKSLRRVVAGTAALLFLACQGMAYASASLPDTPQSHAGAAQESCHDADREAGKGMDNCPAPCKFQNTSSTPPTFFCSATDLPAINIRFEPFLIVEKRLPPAVSRLARIEPPPFTILHCCLRN